jgi:hypothetical protein
MSNPLESVDLTLWEWQVLESLIRLRNGRAVAEELNPVLANIRTTFAILRSKFGCATVDDLCALVNRHGLPAKPKLGDRSATPGVPNSEA